jgi:hypothetical protein
VGVRVKGQKNVGEQGSIVKYQRKSWYNDFPITYDGFWEKNLSKLRSWAYVWILVILCQLKMQANSFQSINLIIVLMMRKANSSRMKLGTACFTDFFDIPKAYFN